MTSSEKKTRNSGKKVPPAKRIRRWLSRIGIALIVLVGIYVLFRLI
jgi:hypothetical protein